jgi:carboxymethylenebutenolidase
MKKILFLLFATFTFVVQAQRNCCAPISSTDAFAALSKEEEFRLSHENPLPFEYKSEVGKMISFPTKDGKTASAFLLKSAKKSNKWLIVYQEWWGLNDYIKKQAETFYNDLEGVNVLAIDMYDGKIATNREDAGKYMQEAKEERLNAIIEGMSKYTGKKAQIASVGWCFGGGLSLKSAIITGKKTLGCIMYYGMPVKDVEQLKTLNCDVLGLFAGREKWISKEVVADFEKNMKAASKTLTVKSYDAEHAFANPSNPNFDKEATADAYNLAIDYLKKRLK